MTHAVQSNWKRISTTFINADKPPLVPIAILTIMVLAAIFAPLIAPDSPRIGSLSEKLLPPAWMEEGKISHLLGTDQQGRDVLSRLIYGARISLSVAALAVFFAGTIGTAIGVVSGYFGGRTDAILMRLTDITFSIPLILMAIVLVAALGPSFYNLTLVITILLWPYYARQVRAESLSLKKQDFVALARIAGCSNISIMLRHILPNTLPTILVLATLQAASVILLEAALSFLGVGIPPPTPAWGLMVGEGRLYIATAWWLSIWPGLAILLTVLSMNLLGDWLRDWLDPKLRQTRS